MPALTCAVSVQHATVMLPDGSTPWRDLTFQLHHGLTGLVGRNGSGKSLLARVIAGVLPPTHGDVHAALPVAWLPQHPAAQRHADVAALSGFSRIFAALARLQNGHGDAGDLLLAEGQWDLPERLQHALEDAGVGRLSPDTPSHQLSGGEIVRVMLAGLFLQEARYLVLDEPGNHLDAAGREWLARRLRTHRPGALVISHDRALLAEATRILALDGDGLPGASQHALHSHAGNYDSWRTARKQQRDAALATLAHARKERRQGERALRAEQEKQQRRAAEGRRKGRDSNQARILLDRQKERSQAFAGTQTRRHTTRQAALTAEVNEAAAQVTAAPAIHFLAPDSVPAAGRTILTLTDLVLPHSPPQRPPITLTLHGPARLAITGPNGAGKSTLLQLIQTQRLAHVPTALLAQDGHLSSHSTALSALLAIDPTLPEGEARMRLAQAGLDSAVIQRPAQQLSGGERLKAALICVLSQHPTPQLLLLDEPDNHIDPAAIEAVEQLLRSWRGALLVVSHSRHFLDALDLTGELSLTQQGWHLSQQAR